MKRFVGVLMLFLLVVALAALETTGQDPKTREEPVPVDLTGPDSWEAAVSRQQQDLDRLAQALISTAKDQKRTDQERRKAIDLLAIIGNSRCLAFLARNIGMMIPTDTEKGDADAIRVWPCTYALSGIGWPEKKNWNAVPVMLHVLAQPTERSESELRRFTFVLKSICGRKVAAVLVAQRLSDCSDLTGQKNLSTVQHYLAGG